MSASKKRRKRNEKVYISLKPNARWSGGGANTFAWNFKRFLAKQGVLQTNNILCASKAIIIANIVNYNLLWLAKKLRSPSVALQSVAADWIFTLGFPRIRPFTYSDNSPNVFVCIF